MGRWRKGVRGGNGDAVERARVREHTLSFGYTLSQEDKTGRLPTGHTHL